MGWWHRLGRKDRGRLVPIALAFDALIDLNPGDLPAGLSRDGAIAVVVEAVGALPGAGWISVEVHPRTAPVAAQVFPAGTSSRQTGDAWLTLQLQVQDAAGQALQRSGAEPAAYGAAMLDRRVTGTFEEMLTQRRRLGDLQAPVGPRPVRGFGEAVAPLHLDALAQLAALAQTTKQSVSAQPKPMPSSPPVPSSLKDVELTARLLEFVLPTDGRSTADAAVRRFGSFAAVLAAPETELRQVPGLGTHSVAAIKLVHAAAVRLARAGVTGQPVLEDSERLMAYLTTALARERIEQFRILFLDDRGMLRADEVQATGTVNHTPVYPREVVRRALELDASSLVLVHNHPSGDPTPSRDDIDMTRQIMEAAGALSIEVRDHLIIGNGRWLSFRDAGLMD